MCDSKLLPTAFSFSRSSGPEPAQPRRSPASTWFAGLGGLLLVAGCSTPPTPLVMAAHTTCVQPVTRVVYSDSCQGFDRYGQCYNNGLAVVKRETVCKQDRCDAGFQRSEGGSCVPLEAQASLQ